MPSVVARRIAFLALFLVALFRVHTVNQAELADAFASRTQAASNRKRLKRFFSQFEFDEDEIARLMVGLAGIPKPWTLSLDRFERVFCPVKVDCLTADREFIGEEWFSYLLLSRIPFRIRIRMDFCLHRADFRHALQLLSPY